MIGVRLDGTKELIAVEDGYREGTESWRTVMRDLKARSMAAQSRPLAMAPSPSGRGMSRSLLNAGERRLG